MPWKIFIPLISFIGFILGVLLSKFLPEEMRPGQKYFYIFRYIIISALIILLFYSSQNYFMLAAGVILGFFFRFTYFYLGIAMAGAFLAGPQYIVLVASLIFVFGLPEGSMIGFKKKYNWKSVLIMLVFFLLPLIILIWPQSFRPDIMLSLSAGLLLGEFKFFLKKFK